MLTQDFNVFQTLAKATIKAFLIRLILKIGSTKSHPLIKITQNIIYIIFPQGKTNEINKSLLEIDTFSNNKSVKIQ